MLQTTLCYIEKDEKYLMMHRIKKINDINKDKWIGIGGKLEKNETPQECMLREIKEETGLDVLSWQYRGTVNFSSDIYDDEIMHLFTIDGFCGAITECDEGTLEWIDKKDLLKLNLWEGDRIFLKLISKPSCGFFNLDLEYSGERLVRAVLDGKNLALNA